MISISKLYLAASSPSDSMRYGDDRQGSRGQSSNIHERPVVVWNMTRRCNLNCRHCYSESNHDAEDDELSTSQAMSLIKDLAAFKVPVLLFSGGEPLAREDVFDLGAYAVDKGMRVVLSTNGTMLNENTVTRLKTIGFSYIGVSLDGIGEKHDYFRNCPGAFGKTLNGMRRCRDAGLSVGLRFTVVRDNLSEVPAIFDLLERERFPRVCFYHLAYSGRGDDIRAHDTTTTEKRQLMDLIVDRVTRLHESGEQCQTLTVGTHADGPYLYLKIEREKNRQEAERMLTLLRRNGGNSSGVGIGCVSWDGAVYPDQFWRTRPLGNALERPFSEIWLDSSNSFLAKLKEKKAHVKGRCANCRFLDACGGNLRARADSLTGDPWASDPACYLTDQEISLSKDD